MPTNRTTRRRESRASLSPAAIDAWKRADLWDLHHALGLPRWHLSPLPESVIGAYGVPDQPTSEAETGLVMDGTWHEAKALQTQLYLAAGEPGRDAE